MIILWPTCCQTTVARLILFVLVYFVMFDIIWAIPGRTAIPGRPAARAEQAPCISPKSKNQFNIEVAVEATYQILS